MEKPFSGSNLKQAVPFFMVSSMEKSLGFYVTGLGFGIKRDWRPAGKIEWCWLEREGVALMLQEYRKEYVPAERLGLGVSVYFMCENALRLYHEFLENGLAPAEPFVGNQMWVVSLKDPDGYQLHFESKTEVPEETTYAQWKENQHE